MSLASQNAESIDTGYIQLGEGFHAAFKELFKALEYADDLGRSAWDFAVDLPTLRRLSLSNNDLRWLVGTEMISYASETTAVADIERTFRRTPRLILNSRTCFVLTPKGIGICRNMLNGMSGTEAPRGFRSFLDWEHISAPPARHVPAPTWDRVQQELRVGDVVVKRFRVPAESQETILAAFEEEAWPARIDDPLPPRGDQSPKRRLQETIKSLNRNQKQPIIRFLGDGNARGILWKYCDSASVCAVN